jgi:3-oxoacyl-[acyl-carrier-protein] synthase-3
MTIRSVLVGTGSHLPEKILTNADLEKIVETNDQWIVERTGISERHIAADDEFTSDIATKAAKKALKDANISAADLDLIIVATTTPDNTFPSTACKVQANLGNKTCAAFDIQAVCTGFIYALSTADKFIQSGQYKNVLVIGSETLSRIIDWTDRGTCILFGDGAGAFVLQGQPNTEAGILSAHLYSDGSTRDLLYVDSGAAQRSGEVGKLRMLGQEVFKHAVTKLVSCTKDALVYNNLTVDDVDWVIPHQANQRILEATAKKLRASDKLISTVKFHGNTSAASIPLAIDAARKDNRIQPNQLLALQAIGGGLTWGSCLIRT